jgi:hypothetical protein
MRSRSFGIILAIAVIPALGVPVVAFAQQSTADSISACERAAKLMQTYDQSVIKAGRLAARGNAKQEQRQYAVARLLGCGAIAGTMGASTIRQSRALADTAALMELESPFSNLIDSAVVSAAEDVAADPSASEPARIAALRTMWVLASGKYWVGYDRLLPTRASTAANPAALCGDGLRLTDATPYWIGGAKPPSGFTAAIVARARKLVADRSQPLAIRSAATCAASE